jgi:hypothetical protein
MTTEVVWHPVTEEPPKYVIVFAASGSDPVCAVLLAQKYGPYWINMGGDPIEGVTHWAHIAYPDPPEVE